MLGEAASRLLWRHFKGRPIVGSAGGDHHVIDRGWEILEERVQGGRILGVEGRGALRVELERCLLEAFRLRPVRMTLAPSARARRAVSSPMPALPPMTTTVWPSSSGSRWVDTAVIAVVMIPPVARAPRAATRPRRREAWLRIFVVGCSLPCDPPVGGHSCNGE